MPGADRVGLDGPYSEQDGPERAGALRSDASVPVRVYALPQLCYRCGGPTRSIVGVVAPPGLTEDPDGFVPIDDCADALARALPRDELRRRGVGDLRRRSSRARPDGYTANGCVDCDTIMGNFPLREELLEWLSQGRQVTDLDLVATVLLPVSALAGSV